MKNFISIGSKTICQPKSLRSVTDHHFLILYHNSLGPETEDLKLNENECLLATGAPHLCTILGRAFLQTDGGELILLVRTYRMTGGTYLARCRKKHGKLESLMQLGIAPSIVTPK